MYGNSKIFGKSFDIIHGGGMDLSFHIMNVKLHKMKPVLDKHRSNYWMHAT
jgi:cysteinyl-tRNA synthetase